MNVRHSLTYFYPEVNMRHRNRSDRFTGVLCFLLIAALGLGVFSAVAFWGVTSAQAQDNEPGADEKAGAEVELNVDVDDSVFKMPEKEKEGEQ